MRVPRRTAGSGGPEVSVLSLGSWHTWDRMDFADAVTLVRRAFDAGVNLFDVGHYDSGPHAERSHTDVLFGRIVQAAGLPRPDYLLCQKLWLWRYPEQSLADQLARSLFRVGADHADIVVLGDFVGRLDIPRVVSDVAALLRDGGAAYWGVNNWAAADLAAAHAFAVREGMPAPVLAQLKYSVCRRSIADGEPYGRIFADLGVALQASDVLEGGILARTEPPTRDIGAPDRKEPPARDIGGAPDRTEPPARRVGVPDRTEPPARRVCASDRTGPHGRRVPVRTEVTPRRIGADPGGIRAAIASAAPELAAVAARLGCTPAQLAIGFCLTHPAIASVLFGASRIEQLVDDLGAVELVARHGDTLRAEVGHLWRDREAVRSDASWGATREDDDHRS